MKSFHFFVLWSLFMILLAMVAMTLLSLRVDVHKVISEQRRQAAPWSFKSLAKGFIPPPPPELVDPLQSAN